MRLLMTTDTVGGVWTFTSELAGELLARGNEVALVSFGRRPSQEQTRCITNLTVRFPRLLFHASEAPLEWMPENAAAYDAGEPLLLELCDRFKPNAMLLSQFCFGALPVEVPKIVVAHSDVLSWADAVGKAPLQENEWLRTYRSLVQRGLHAADTVIAPTRTMLEDLRRHFALPVQAAVIPNGRSLDTLPHTQSRKLQAVAAGRMWDEAKHLKLLFRCESPLPILIAGESSKADRESGQAKLLGRQNQADLLRLFQRSAMYICSSVYEPFGLAPLEAALCGCAVLACDIPSLREVWGDAALYFHDAASLSQLLNDLYTSAAELDAAQARSQARARTYTSARMADGYMQWIAQVTSAMVRGEARAA